MWWFGYQALLLLAWPAVHVRLRLRARREPAYGERIPERFGHVPDSVRAGGLWFHTVSAGETIAAAPLVADIAAGHPELPCLVTTMTPTGSAQVRNRLGDRVDHCYAPYDFPWAVRRFFDRVRPRLLVLMETELWPNLVAEAWRRDVPVLLVNARLSARSAAGYARLGSFTRTLLGRLRWIACQYPDHARRFVELGAPAERVVVHGSVKFDVVLPADHQARMEVLQQRWQLADAPVWIAASTHAGEEAQALEAHRRLRAVLPAARLILVPRHPARADEVAALCHRYDLSVARQSESAAGERTAPVLLGDVMGELLYLYGLADAAFVGGSLVATGGHNPIEPAVCGVPMVMGPHVFNFPDVVAAFQAAGCLPLIHGSDDLADTIGAWLEDRQTRLDQARRAAAVVADHGGATARLRALLEAQIGELGAPAAAPDGG
jgi:3-deoxy-D-manno-octulosonic-acid transferase